MARNIGVTMDSKLDMTDHVKSICRAAYVQLRQIAQIRRYLTQEATTTLMLSLVMSKLDSLNALLYGLPDHLIHKLQLLQNQAAKIIFKKKKSDHVTPILIQLHWLPVKYRIQYKLLLLTFKCIQGKAPQYLTSLIELYTPPHALRSGNTVLLKEKKGRLKYYGDRAFSVAAPHLWNNLPQELRHCDTTESFKKELKTFFFRQAFYDNT